VIDKPNPCEDASSDLDAIWLAPRCCIDPEMGRMRCEDPQDSCPDCGARRIWFTRDRRYGRRGRKGRTKYVELTGDRSVA
jgi:hypothetical protein